MEAQGKGSVLATKGSGSTRQRHYLSRERQWKRKVKAVSHRSRAASSKRGQRPGNDPHTLLAPSSEDWMVKQRSRLRMYTCRSMLDLKAVKRQREGQGKAAKRQLNVKERQWTVNDRQWKGSRRSRKGSGRSRKGSEETSEGHGKAVTRQWKVKERQ